MLAGLVAIIVWVLVAVAGAFLIWRQLPRASALRAGEMVCLGCGTPGRMLPADSFLCPVCRHDVRVLGISRRKPRAFTAPFWRIVTFSALLCLVALITSALVLAALPQVEYGTLHAAIVTSGPNPERLQITYDFRQTGRKPPEGELYADLIPKSGEMITLKVEAPSLQYRIADTSGREPATSEGTFDDVAVERWMKRAGLAPANGQTHDLAQWAYAQVVKLLRAVPQSTLPPPPAMMAMTTSDYSSGSAGPPEYAALLALIIWSLLWLAGIWLILRRATRKSAASPPSGRTPACS